MPSRTVDAAPGAGVRLPISLIAATALVAAAALAASPVRVQAATKIWTVTASPMTLTQGQTTTVSLLVTATGGTNIGCVVVSIPAGFTVIAAAAPVPWISQVQAGSPAKVQFNVTSDPQRLTKGASATFSVTVRPVGTNLAAWTVSTFDKFTATSPTNGLPTSPLAPFTIAPAPTPLPTPVPTRTPSPTPPPTATPTALPTPIPTTPSTPPPSATTTGHVTPTATSAATSGATAVATATTAAGGTPSTAAVPSATSLASASPTAGVTPPGTGVIVFTTPEGTPLEVSAADFLGDEASGATVALNRTTSHGQLAVSPDGSFRYVPDAGFVGVDSFTVVVASGSAASAPLQITIDVVARAASASPPRSPSPQPTSSGDAFFVGGTAGGGSSGQAVSFGTLGPLDFAFDWLVPGFVMMLPGLLVLLAVLIQALAGAMWLPVARRELGDFGLGRRPKLG